MMLKKYKANIENQEFINLLFNSSNKIKNIQTFKNLISDKKCKNTKVNNNGDDNYIRGTS
jgi:hypothetical protein